MSARKTLYCILLFALTIRAVAALGLSSYLASRDRSFLIAGDAQGYWELGGRIAAGEPYEIRGQPQDPLAQASLPRQIPRMPGFPLLLGGVRGVVGDSRLAARLVLAVVGTIACWLVYRLGRRLFDESTGLLAAACCAVSPTIVGFSVLLLGETLFAVALLACLLAAVPLVPCRVTARPGDLGHVDDIPAQRPSLAAATLTGLAGCLAVYVRPGWLAAIPLFCLLLVALAADRRRAISESLIVIGVVLVGLGPWMWRNYHTTGHAVLTTLWVGPSLYDGLRPGATGDSDMRFVIDDGLFARSDMTEFKIDQHYRQKAWDFAMAHPATVARLACTKCFRLLKPWPSAEQFSSWWQMALVALPTTLLYVFAVRGGWQVRHTPWSWLILAGPLLYLAALHLVFVGSLRYRVPAEYPLWILATAGLRRRTPS